MHESEAILQGKLDKHSSQGEQDRGNIKAQGNVDLAQIRGQGAQDRANIDAQGTQDVRKIGAQGTEDRANITTQQAAQGARDAS